MLKHINLMSWYRHVGDVAAVNSPMHGASANVHGVKSVRPINLGEVVAHQLTHDVMFGTKID